MAIIQGMKTKKGADVYDGFADSRQSFAGIGVVEACNGDIILRGRNGQRDKLFRLSDAVDRYNSIMEFDRKLCLNGIAGWVELAEILDDFKHKICEAVAYRKKMNMEVPKNALVFVEQSTQSSSSGLAPKDAVLATSISSAGPAQS